MEPVSENNSVPQITQEPLNVVPPPVFEPIVEYAGFWYRVAASFFDGALTFFFGFGFGIILVIFNLPIPQIISDIVPLLIFWLYFSLMESSDKQATVGKRIFGIRVTDINGNKISFLRATGRTFAKFLSVITLGIGFLMIAFTKKKQGLHDVVSETVVVKQDESHVWKAILVSFVSFLIILGMVVAYGYFVLWPTLIKYFFTNITIVTEPNKISNIEPQDEQVVSKPNELVSFSEMEYDALLSKPLTGLEGTNVGPAVLNISDFWEDEKPHIWIDVMLPELPNFDFNRSLTKVAINSVQNKNGQNIYDPSNNFETEFFQSFTVSEISDPITHLQGIRDVYLISGTNEEAISSINGKLILSLPIGIKELSFTSSDVGKQKESAGISVNVSAIQNSQVLWTYQGPGKNFFSIKAYNSQGQELSIQSGINPAIDENYTKPFDLKSIFSGDIAQVKVFIVSEIKDREYPFVIQKGNLN